MSTDYKPMHDLLDKMTRKDVYLFNTFNDVVIRYDSANSIFYARYSEDDEFQIASSTNAVQNAINDPVEITVEDYQAY